MPRVSLVASVLSICYVAGSSVRGTGAADAGGEGGRTLVGFVDDHYEFLIAFVSTLVLAVVAHVALSGTAFFYPSVIWGPFALTVVVVGIGEVAGVEPLD